MLDSISYQLANECYYDYHTVMNVAMMNSHLTASPSEAYMELSIAKLCFYHTNDKGLLVTTKRRCYCIRSYYRGRSHS